MILDVSYSLRFLDYVNNLYLLQESGSVLNSADLNNFEKIANSELVIDSRVPGFEFNKVVYDFVFERFFSYQSNARPPIVNNFTKILD